MKEDNVTNKEGIIKGQFTIERPSPTELRSPILPDMRGEIPMEHVHDWKKIEKTFIIDDHGRPNEVIIFTCPCGATSTKTSIIQEKPTNPSPEKIGETTSELTHTGVLDTKPYHPLLGEKKYSCTHFEKPIPIIDSNETENLFEYIVDDTYTSGISDELLDQYIEGNKPKSK